jgi:hypothetical protein
MPSLSTSSVAWALAAVSVLESEQRPMKQVLNIILHVRLVLAMTTLHVAEWLYGFPGGICYFEIATLIPMLHSRWPPSCPSIAYVSLN